MSEVIGDKKIFSLLEVAQSIQRTLEKRYGGVFWVKAEMNKLNFYPHSGHCYPDLVEKREGKVVAQMRANLWKGDFQRINANFMKVLKEPLKDGIQILLCARVSFSPNYGLALNIVDIDPAFTLGELEKEKFETIAALKQEGIFGLNKSLPMPVLPQRIAIVSVETSKGLADFRKVIDQNAWGYRFFCMLFPALLQGDAAAPSIRNQLKRIEKVKAHFDAVAIIRGGGGDVGLTCYNDYHLARAVCTFPLPVLSGIGHSTNETVTEMVSHQNAITPTELADFLLQHFHDFSVPVAEAERTIRDYSLRLLEASGDEFQRLVKDLLGSTKQVISAGKRNIEEGSRSIVQHSRYAFRRQHEWFAAFHSGISRGAMARYSDAHKSLSNALHSMQRDSLHRCAEEHKEIVRLAGTLLKESRSNIERSMVGTINLEKLVRNLHPENVLRRGYSITLKDGKAVRSSDALTPGDVLETKLYQGTFTSKVERTGKSKTL